MRPSIQRAKVVADLRARIERGDPGYRPGDLLRTHAELALDYDVSARTAGNAVAELTAAGLTESAGRGGTRVLGPPPGSMFLVADRELRHLRLVGTLEEAERAAELAGGVVAELRIAKDYRRK